MKKSVDVAMAMGLCFDQKRVWQLSEFGVVVEHCWNFFLFHDVNLFFFHSEIMVLFKELHCQIVGVVACHNCKGDFVCAFYLLI